MLRCQGFQRVALHEAALHEAILHDVALHRVLLITGYSYYDMSIAAINNALCCQDVVTV